MPQNTTLFGLGIWFTASCTVRDQAARRYTYKNKYIVVLNILIYGLDKRRETAVT